MNIPNDMLSGGQLAAQSFRANYPNDIATIGQFRKWVDEYNGNLQGSKAHSSVLKFWIEWAGMITVGRSVRIKGKPNRVFGVRNFNAETIKKLDPQIIRMLVK